MSEADFRYMSLALALGRRGLGQVAPWPSVGCVIVNNGRIVGRGVSDPARLMHAEPVALEQAGTAAKGATAYVTLEPCSHHGRTPPCANALIKAGVKRVVAALTDPNPLVAGQGLSRLKDAGIQVDTGVLADEARQDHIGFLNVQTLNRPMVTLKLANSFDGRIATASGESKWITGPLARRLTHAMRAQHDAVLVGSRTVREDDPALTVRDLGVKLQPSRIVWSRHLDIPKDGNLINTASETPVLVCHGGETAMDKAALLRDKGVQLVEVPIGDNGQIDPAGALANLAEIGITRIFCEGGGTLAAALLQADVVDRLVGFTAGIAIGAEGKPNLGAMGLSSLQAANRFKLEKCNPIGNDVVHVWWRK